ncbi:probable palmitoyltransferase ZDHHC24 [Bacillus rossius redtenbacheri]|uniref:probable palmitoyltransferase ZDHHC24 n=1 Tax=Bacillus rossius redtenbacheri TaxID=93214 RepID=UPI002FDCDA2A
MQLALRKTMYLKTPTDFGSFSFVLLIIPITYYFELFVVLPSMYPPGTLWYNFHFICGTLLMINITSSFVATIIVDTSIAGKVMPSEMEKDCRFCAVCETIAPPRSWHCDICKICILKRDHHCVFTGCCIGYFNHRYFFMFVMYLFIATFYGTYFNNYFIWSDVNFWNLKTVFKLVFPLAMLAFGFDTSYQQFYLLIYLINTIGTLFTFALLCIHVKLIMSGCATYEKNHGIHSHNYGLHSNIREVLGKKWYIAWICPFIKSELPQDGIHWSETHVHSN